MRAQSRRQDAASGRLFASLFTHSRHVLTITSLRIGPGLASPPSCGGIIPLATSAPDRSIHSKTAKQAIASPWWARQHAFPPGVHGLSPSALGGFMPLLFPDSRCSSSQCWSTLSVRRSSPASIPTPQCGRGRYKAKTQGEASILFGGGAQR